MQVRSSQDNSLHLQKDYHGVLSDSAEIIPIEPDAASTAEGI